MPDSFDYERFCDDLGPAKVVHLYDPATGLRGIVVVDNVACGPSIGGVRMASDVTTNEVFRLARAMTFKNAAAGLPHGGGKAGILADPKVADKPALVRSFARAIRSLAEYIPGPDMGTDESCMAWIHAEIGRAVGLPRVFGGIPLDEIGATGYGLAECAEVAAPFCDLQLAGATVAIEGFGNVGRNAARFLEQRGAKLVAASDSGGGVFDSRGISAEELAAVSRKAGSVAAYEKGERISLAALLTVPCDILIPAARPDSIHPDNAQAIQARLILQGANIPATREAEAVLYRRGIVSVPDFIANAGGVICAAAEYKGETQAAAFAEIAERIRRNTQDVLNRSRSEKIEPRKAALELAHDRVRAAMALRDG
ncbi:MAG: Glu/Leu/Phe/Val family dehydrogenase [Planctomycetales bacterium]